MRPDFFERLRVLIDYFRCFGGEQRQTHRGPIHLGATRQLVRYLRGVMPPLRFPIQRILVLLRIRRTVCPHSLRRCAAFDSDITRDIRDFYCACERDLASAGLNYLRQLLRTSPGTNGAEQERQRCGAIRLRTGLFPLPEARCPR